MNPDRPAWQCRGKSLRLSIMFLIAVAGLIYPWDAITADQKGTSPSRSQQRTPENYIDTMLGEACKREGVKSAPPAGDEEFLRRAYLDLIGRIPSVPEARSFLQTREADRREKLIEYLLQHPDFTKNFATQWTILLIGRSRQERMVDRSALSSWLRKQFAADRPWNEIIRDLITATGSNKENGAVNYTLAHLESEAVPLTSRTTRLFLGQQLQCTQCHDHPTNSWKQADFWGINAFLKGVKTEDLMKVDGNGLEVYDYTELSDEPTDAYSRYERRNGMMGVALPRFLDGKNVKLGTKAIRRAELGRLVADTEGEQLSRALVNRMWAHFFGRGFVNPVDDLGPHNPPSHPELFDRLSHEFRSKGYHVKDLIRRIVNSRAYQLTSVRVAKARGRGQGTIASAAAEKEDSLFAAMSLRPMSPEQLFDSLLTATSAHRAGNPGQAESRREQWLRQFLFTFGNDEGDETTFQGTIPQALMMMNGPLMQEAVSGNPGSYLANLLERAQEQSQSAGDFMVHEIYLAALTRKPNRRELEQATHFLSTCPDPLQVIQDLFWALLNSNEFVLIH